MILQEDKVTFLYCPPEVHPRLTLSQQGISNEYNEPKYFFSQILKFKFVLPSMINLNAGWQVQTNR